MSTYDPVQSAAIPDLGIVEGRFGRVWNWTERAAVMRALAPHGFRFFHYGPKADAYLRRAWRVPHPVEEAEEIARFAADCHSHGVRFGAMLTPMNAGYPLDADTRDALRARLAQLDALGIDDLVVSFDDIHGDLPDLAARQAELVAFCGENSRATRLYFCPTYYSDDPILDRVFGRRPEAYLADLGRRLDPAVRIYWTGEEVCSREIGVGHLRRVAGELGRPVCLWDNYPVNDGARMSNHLHLRAFTGRPAEIGAHLSGHAINPAMQPLLTCIPAITLAASYREGADYAYGAAFLDAAVPLVGGELAHMIQADLPSFQEVGLDRLGARRETLRSRYAAVDHAAAREIVGWLDGEYLVTDDEVKTQ